MLSYDGIGSEEAGREVLQIEGHDHIGPTMNCGGQDMPVIRIRQFKLGDERFKILHQAITSMFVHEAPGVFELSSFDVRSIAKHSRDPLVMNPVRPSSLEQAFHGQLHEQVA